VKIRQIIKTVFMTEIVAGMALTLKTMFTHAVTRQYPKERRPAMPGFRGLHALTRNPQTGEARCVGCGLCAAICPSQCIHIYTIDSPDHTKVVERYEIEVLRCIYCAFCVEACPYSAIALTGHYEYSAYSKEDLYMTKEKLLSNYDKYMGWEKDQEYFKKFWHPLSADFGTPEDQAVFKKRRETL
jgi:NADH-quinone oxidoreductase subunit I